MKKILHSLKNIYLFLITIAAFTACHSSSGEKNKTNNQAEVISDSNNDSNVIVSITQAQLQSAGITFGNIEHHKLNTAILVNGLVDVPPQSQVSISFPYGGFVKKINVLEGDYVKRGSLLAILENPEYVDLQERYLKDKSSLEYARQEYQRQKELYKADVAAGKSFQKAQSDYESLQASFNAVRQKLMMIGINPAHLSPENIRSSVAITAPDNGYVTRIDVNQGKYTDAQQELLELDNTKNIHIDLTVYEKDMNKVSIGQHVLFYSAGASAQEQQAKVILIGKQVKEDRSFVVHAVPLDKNKYYMPGTYVQARIQVGNKTSNVLPKDAVVRSDGKQYIFIRTNSNNNNVMRFEMVPVAVGTEDNDYIEVQLPAQVSLLDSSIVIKGAFSLLSVLKNTGEEI